LFSVFQNANAAYLSSIPSSIPSPLNIGLENSRRFRALPVYAVLLAYGKEVSQVFLDEHSLFLLLSNIVGSQIYHCFSITEVLNHTSSHIDESRMLTSRSCQGFAEMFARQVRLARRISGFLDGCEGYELFAQHERLKAVATSDRQISLSFPNTHIIVLFRAKSKIINDELVARINATRKMYVSGTRWNGNPACRIAVSTWRVDVERDFKLVKEVLEKVLES
jgi:hypothetical protein